MSAVVKPVSGIGQAVSDIGHGVAAQVGQISGIETTQALRRLARRRGRLPRLLYFRQGALRPYADLDAQVLCRLGQAKVSGIEVVLPLVKPVGVLLLFPDKLLVVD